MKLNKKLNFVIPVVRDEGVLYVHATPISRETFEANYLLISKTFANIYTGGLGAAAGPRVAAMAMKDVAANFDAMLTEPAWAPRVEAFLTEIRRLATVVPIAGKGDVVMLQDALDAKMLDEDEVSEVENAIVFFTVASAMHLRSELPTILAGVSRVWDAQSTFLSPTEFAASLRTSTGTADSTEKKPATASAAPAAAAPAVPAAPASQLPR